MGEEGLLERKKKREEQDTKSRGRAHHFSLLFTAPLIPYFHLPILFLSSFYYLFLLAFLPFSSLLLSSSRSCLMVVSFVFPLSFLLQLSFDLPSPRNFPPLSSLSFISIRIRKGNKKNTREQFPCSFSPPLRSLYIPLFSFLMISSSATDFGNRRFEILRSCPQGTGRIRNSGTSCGIGGGGGVGERNGKEEGQRKRFAERREGMTHSVT